jgi:hypothetical protein
MLKDKTDCSCLVIEVMEDDLPFLLHCKKMTLRINLFQDEMVMICWEVDVGAMNNNSGIDWIKVTYDFCKLFK